MVQSGKSNGRSFWYTQRIKMYDKAAALEKLGRTLGLFKDRLEHTGKDGGPISLRQLLQEIDGTTRGLPNSRIRDGWEG